MEQYCLIVVGSHAGMSDGIQEANKRLAQEQAKKDKASKIKILSLPSKNECLQELVWLLSQNTIAPTIIYVGHGSSPDRTVNGSIYQNVVAGGALCLRDGELDADEIMGTIIKVTRRETKVKFLTFYLYSCFGHEWDEPLKNYKMVQRSRPLPTIILNNFTINPQDEMNDRILSYQLGQPYRGRQGESFGDDNGHFDLQNNVNQRR